MNNKQINGNIISISKSYHDFETVSTGNINDERDHIATLPPTKKKRSLHTLAQSSRV